MTGSQELVLRSLLADLCASEDASSFSARWGRAEPSQRRPRGLRVVCDPAKPFAVLEVRPWKDDITGVVEVELRAGEQPLSWSAVRDGFGPFEQLPRLHGLDEEYAATWAPRDAPAAAYLIVAVTGDTVDALTIRRDPR